MIVTDLYTFDQVDSFALPLFQPPVAAGFPSPADDYLEQRLDLKAYFVQHPQATYYVRVQGDSMRDAGILSGDILMVDRAVTPVPGSVVVAALNGQLTVKRLGNVCNKPALLPSNPDYQPLVLSEGDDLSVWGVVVGVHRRL